MSQDHTPKNEQDQNQEAGPAPVASTAAPIAPIAWYARPWFWSIIILLLLLALLAWTFWKQWQIYQALQDSQHAEVQKQLDYNASLTDEASRLRELLAKDPCEIKAFLEQDGSTLLLPKGDAPNQTNTAPSTGGTQKAPLNKDMAPPANSADKQGTPPATEAEAPPPPSSETEAPPPNTNSKEEPAPISETPSASSIAQSLEQATVLIIGDAGKAYNTGTGFFIAPGIILTNAHVTDGAKKNLYAVGKFSEVVSKAKVLAATEANGRDYAVLQVPVTSVKPLSFNLDVVRTQKVSAWGFPGAVTDVDPNFTALIEGKVKSAPEVVYSEGSVSVVQDQSPPLIFHTAVVSHGNSGGPLVNEKGEVVGINTYIAMDDKSYRQSSLAIVSKDIVDFLKQHSIPFTLSTKE